MKKSAYMSRSERIDEIIRVFPQINDRQRRELLMLFLQLEYADGNISALKEIVGPLEKSVG